MAVVDLVIKLTDRATSGIKGIGAALSGLGSSASSAASQTQGLSGAIASGVLQANAIQFTISKASEALGFLNSKFEEAKNLQLANITASTTFSSLTGQSYEQAAEFIDRLNNRLAASAAALPGATQDYKNLAIAVQDNVLEAFKDPAGKLNQKGFEDTLASISESFGALSAGSNVAIGNTTLGLSKALGGASTSELRQIQFFEQNAVILNEIDKRLAKMGKSTLKDLNIKERVKLLEEVGKKFITQDFIREAGGSADALIQAYQSSLFDPSAGIFGIMRDLEPNTKGVQSAFSSMNEGLAQLIGPSGVMTNLGNLLTAMGIELPDPMAMLKTGIDFLVGGLKKVNATLTQATAFFKGGGEFSLDAVSKFIFQLGTGLEGVLLNVGNKASSMFSSGVGIISKYLADPMVFYRLGDSLGNFLGRAVGAAITFGSKVNYPQLLLAVGRAALALAIGLGGSLVGFVEGVIPSLVDDAIPQMGKPLATIAAKAGDFIGSLLAPVGEWFNSTASAAGGMINGAIAQVGAMINSAIAQTSTFIGNFFSTAAALGVGAFRAYIGFLANTIPGRIAIGAASVLGTFYQTVGQVLAVLGTHLGRVIGTWATGVANKASAKFNELSNAVTSFFNPIISGTRTAINQAATDAQTKVSTKFQSISTTVSNFGSQVSGLINQAINDAQSKVSAKFQSISQSISNFGNQVAGYIKPPIDATIALVQAISGKISGLINAGRSAIDSAGSAINSFNPVPGIQSGIRSAGASAISSINSFFGAKFAGNIPNAAGGLLGAAGREARAMPSGANLVVANDREFILQDKGRVAATGGRNYTLNFSVASGDPNAIAQAVIAAIQSTFEGDLEAQLG
jgi:hypothetical protein